MTQFGGSFSGLKVLVTGHTGFKGSWLALWLRELGAVVTGIALSPVTAPNHWDLLDLDITSHLRDVRDAGAIADIVRDEKPDIVFHLAAQPLVRQSYADPLETWGTNVLGTANLLESCRQTASVRAIVVVTTDKCYENREWLWGYRETDRLGGHDPYSASKAAAELVTASFRKSFFSASNTLVATARAGNVIGGGDWAPDRLIPDLVRAYAAHVSLEVRSPQSTRPWQHVLESAAGYLLLGQRLLEGKAEFADAWNFGPDEGSNRSVGDVLSAISKGWPGLSWHVSTGSHRHEAKLLWLDTSKAKRALHWKPVWDFEQTLAKTSSWYREFYTTGKPASREQLAEYISDARAAGASWTTQ